MDACWRRWAHRQQPVRPPRRLLWTMLCVLCYSSVLIAWLEVGMGHNGIGLAADATKRISPPIRPGAMSIEIPELKINQRLTELAVIGRSLQVPDDYSDIGWWRDGPWPGRKGAAVVVGHVDSPTGPAVFYRLSSLKPGNLIKVRRANGTVLVFKVKDIKVYDKSEFPEKQVYRTDGPPTLHLLTCGGTFDTATRSYSSNVVVYAPLLKKFVKEPRAKKSPNKKSARNATEKASSALSTGSRDVATSR